jgi:hypothetical protein
MFGVCLEEAIVFVPRPWLLRRNTMYLFIVALSVLVSLIGIGLGLDRDGFKGFLFVSIAAGVIGLLLFQRHMKEKFRQELSTAPASELLRRRDTVRFDLSTIRSLKTNSLRLLVVREGHEDLNMGIFGMRDAVDSALSTAYPGVYTREG